MLPCNFLNIGKRFIFTERKLIDGKLSLSTFLYFALLLTVPSFRLFLLSFCSVGCIKLAALSKCDWWGWYKPTHCACFRKFVPCRHYCRFDISIFLENYLVIQETVHCSFWKHSVQSRKEMEKKKKWRQLKHIQKVLNVRLKYAPFHSFHESMTIDFF